MEPLLMMKTAAWLFGLSALGGLTMAAIRWSGKPQPPAWMAMAHGLLAGAGLTLLLYAACTVGLPSRAQLAVAILTVAAVGGLSINLLFHWKMLPLPKPWIIGHASLAVVGFGVLLSALM